MSRFKNLFIVMAVLSAIIMFTSCQKEPTPVESSQNQFTLPKLVIPAGATITSATLYIYLTGANDEPVTVHRINNDWEETAVTWDNFGGSYEAAEPSTFTASLPTGFKTVDVTALVTGWLDGSYTNYGLLLDQGENAFPISEYLTREVWPANAAYLEICYTVNGGTPVCDTTRTIADTYIWEQPPYNGYNWNYEARLRAGRYIEAFLYEKQILIKFDIDIEQQELECETAYAYDDEPEGTCFIDLGFGNWGWSIYLENPGSYTFPVYAAAGQCDWTKGTYVGDVTAVYAAGTVSFSYDFFGGFSTEETHFYAGYDQVPKNKKGEPTVAPGQYKIGTGLSGGIYIIAHAVVCGNFE